MIWRRIVDVDHASRPSLLAPDHLLASPAGLCGCIRRAERPPPRMPGPRFVHPHSTLLAPSPIHTNIHTSIQIHFSCSASIPYLASAITLFHSRLFPTQFFQSSKWLPRPLLLLSPRLLARPPAMPPTKVRNIPPQRPGVVVLPLFVSWSRLVLTCDPL
jgi:hypothetical protein